MFNLSAGFDGAGKNLIHGNFHNSKHIFLTFTFHAAVYSFCQHFPSHNFSVYLYMNCFSKENVLWEASSNRFYHQKHIKENNNKIRWIKDIKIFIIWNVEIVISSTIIYLLCSNCVHSITLSIYIELDIFEVNMVYFVY